MPIVYKKEHQSLIIAVWESIEELETLLRKALLTNDEMVLYRTFKSDTRKREYLTVRVLLRELFPEDDLIINYSSKGKPSLNSLKGISISHTKNFVAVMVGDFRFGGIDLETINERIFKLSAKFMNEKEIMHFKDPSSEQLQIIWGAKEVLYKINEIGDVDFRKHLYVHPFSIGKSGHLIADILKSGYEKGYEIYFENFAPMMITWAIE